LEWQTFMSVDLEPGKRNRLTLILLVGVVLILAPTALYAVGSARANTEIDRIRKRAAIVSIRVPDLAASTYLNTPDPIAAALSVNDLDISLQSRKRRWCVTVRVRRLLATRTALFMLNQAGSLTRIDQCPPAA
jgi:hypothetical protein